MPIGEKGVLDPGGAGEEGGDVAGLPEGPADFGKAGGVESIKEDDCVTLSGELHETIEAEAGLSDRISTRPMGSVVCRARWSRRSPSSMGVTGWRDMVGWRSMRWVSPSTVAKRFPKAT